LARQTTLKYIVYYEIPSIELCLTLFAICTNTFSKAT
jgi:hypothetical protein